jgi:hypothetical protein
MRALVGCWWTGNDLRHYSKPTNKKVFVLFFVRNYYFVGGVVGAFWIGTDD